MQYSFDDLKRIWIRNGGPAEQAANAAAVAVAESSGNPDARDPGTGTYPNGTYDSGLWQINGRGDITDPDRNARIAVAMWRDRGWEPWCTAWTDGACGTRGGAPSGRTSLIEGSPAYRVLQEYTGSTPAPESVPSNNWSETLVQNLPTLKQGSAGIYVERAQALLNVAGQHSLTVDGVFGAATGAAVREEQHEAGLAVDGVIGEHTWEILLTGSTS